MTTSENKSILTTAKRPNKMSLTPHVYRDIRETIGRLTAEHGGILGGKRNTGEVTHFHFDVTGDRNSSTYAPDINRLNLLLEKKWNPAGIDLIGFVHSHPPGFRRPSNGDEVYACRILGANTEMQYLFLPIIFSEADADKFELVPYLAVRDGNGVQIVELNLGLNTERSYQFRTRVARKKTAISPTLESFRCEILARTPIPLLPDTKAESESAANENLTSTTDLDGKVSPPPDEQTPLSEAERKRIELIISTYNRGKHLPPIQIPLGYLCAPWFDRQKTFDRVRSAYDLDWLGNCRVVVIGVGGAAGFVEDLARCGVGEFALVDHDLIGEENLATQQVYRKDIGRAKVEALADRIRDINPSATVISCRNKLEEFSDDEFSTSLLGYVTTGVDRPQLRQPPTRKVTLLCGFTDNFYAQARVNRLALKFALPSLCAQVYHEGRAAEVTFTFPGLTPACHRCILSGRYKAYLEDAFQNEVGSNGCPLFATSRLNSLKGFIALAILHHGSNHRRWAKLLQRIGNRNLCQLRLDPDLSTTLRLDVFDRVFRGADRDRLFFDEVVWLPQVHECPSTGYSYHCPDCGGTGDLRTARGRFPDTRIMQPCPNERVLMSQSSRPQENDIAP